MKKVFILPLLYLLTFVCSSCSDKEYITETPPNELRPEITVIFTPNGLGDLGYNDLVLQGFQTIYQNNLFIKMYLYAPHSIQEAEDIFTDWIQRSTSQRSLCILATSDYEQMVNNYFTQTDTLPKGKDVLLFESNNPHNLPITTFRLSMYGASYLAGVCAATSTKGNALIVGGSSSDTSIQSAFDGFTDGYKSITDDTPDTAFIASSYEGYAQPITAYYMMGRWSRTYSFIYPVAGGSNLGIYKFIRDYNPSVFTTGMDVDQSHLCNKITGSLIKRLDKLVAFYTNLWLSGNSMPRKAVYGLGSQFVDWTLAPSYSEELEVITNTYRDQAIQKENEYEY